MVLTAERFLRVGMKPYKQTNRSRRHIDEFESDLSGSVSCAVSTDRGGGDRLSIIITSMVK